MQMPTYVWRLPQRRHELAVDVVDLDRRQAQPFQAGNRADLTHEARQRIAGRSVPIAAEIDPGEDDLLVPVRDASLDLAEHGRRGAASRSTANERDHTEVAGEAAAVLDLHEGAHPVETGVRLDAADCAHVPGHEGRCLLARPGDDRDVGGETREGVAGEIRRAAGHVDALVRSRRAHCGLARLSNRLVRDAAGVHDRDLGGVRPVLDVPVREQALADFLCVRVGDLAAEETDRERRHGRDANWLLSAAQRPLRNDPPPSRRV
jgi:hypothetical protein